MKGIRLIVALIAASVVVATGAYWNDAASADPESTDTDSTPLLMAAGEAGENADTVSGPITDSQQASQLPHRDLGREEAIELLEGVFSAELEAPAGPFDELDVEKFLADNVALIAPGDQPEPVEGESSSGYHGPSLMVSTVPLRAEGPSGEEEAVELGLDHAEGELQPTNPLIEVGMPSELGQGIALPETGLTINLDSAPEQTAPSTVDGSVAVYPNVSQDTDLVVAPTPTGVETFMHIRSADAPTSQIFELDLPSGATLESTEEGGALILQGDQPIIEVSPPDAIDAGGDRVPVTLEVVGDSLVLTTQTDQSVQYPVLVDPLYQSYKWEAGKPQTGIHFSETQKEEWTPQVASAYYEYPWCNPCQPYTTSTAQNPSVGLAAFSSWYSVKKGEHAAWIYTVPRYFKDPERPTSFISNFTLTGLTQWANSPYHDPYLEAGLWDVFKDEWGSSIVYHEGLEGHSLNDANWEYKMPNPNGNVNDKMASVGLWATQDTPNGPGNVKATSATIELAEPTDPAKNKPVWGTIAPPSTWMDKTAAPVEFTVQDTGLGVSLLKTGNGTESWTTSFGCTGVGGNACPRTWSRPFGTQPDLNYDPSKLPQGTNTLTVTAEDPLGHTAESTFQVKVDHTQPGLALSGALTEQGRLGKKLGSYKLNLTATDGTEAVPQSGIKKTVIEVDGKVVDEASPGCATKNCAVSREWTLDSSQFSLGSHTVSVTATDMVGLSTTKSLSIELLEAAPPSLSLSGTVTEQAALGVSRPRYQLNVDASAEAGFEGAVGISHAYVIALGTEGVGAGQLKHPAGVAVDPKGNLWVADRNNNRIEVFNEKGEFVQTFGKEVNKTKVEAGGTEAEKNVCTAASGNVCQAGKAGSGNAQFSWPTSVAIDSKGNVWVLDAWNERVQKLNEKGEFVAKFATSIEEGEGIAVDAKGNVWTANTWSASVKEFNEKGELLRTIGKAGTGAGQFGQPAGVAVDPKGNVWVADWSNYRISEFNEKGEFVQTFGKEVNKTKVEAGGTEIERNVCTAASGNVCQAGKGGGATDQLNHPSAVSVDAKGIVWAIAEGNGRVEAFNEKGEYLAQFGAKGTGNGQFSFSRGNGLATDTRGNIWVADSSGNRVERWNQATAQSTIDVRVTVDGKEVSKAQAACSTERCPTTSAWTLEAPSLATGKHTLQVAASDGLGRTSTKTVSVETQPDKTKPTLDSSGPLVNAPEGWVEQDTYNLTASATDAGYGVTSLVATIDGKQVASWTNACPEGGCKGAISKAVDMSVYPGGAHPAEIVATDGAGNITKQGWTINVDPEGHVSSVEAIDTLEAADETAESTIVAPASAELEPEQMEGGDNPSLVVTGEQIESEGIPDTTSMSTDPGGGFTIEGPEAEATFTPIVSEKASKTEVTEGIAAVSANTASSVDSIIRPVFNGAQTFQAIRSSDAPEKYSWSVKLAPSQKLVSIDSQFAKVVYEDGSTAFLITAEGAHDVTGVEVPTSIEVSGNVLTLTVAFKTGQFTFPIIAGQGWETSYEIPTYVELPEDEHEIYLRELAEKLQREEEEQARAEAEGVVFPEGSEPPPPPTPLTEKQAKWYVSLGPCCGDTAAPPYPDPNQASASTIRTFILYRSQCGPSCGKWKAQVYNAAIERGFKWARWEQGTEVHAKVDQAATWATLIWPTTWNCGTVGQTFVKKGSGDHMTAYAHFTVESWFLKKGTPTATPAESNFAFQVWVYPNAFQEKHIIGWSGQPSDKTCPKVAGT